MTEKEYYKKSDNKNIGLRCPILNICQRRAFSIYALSYQRSMPKINSWEGCLIENGELGDSYLNKKVEIQGESPDFVSGRNGKYGSFSSLCPEVNLFDKNHRLISPPVAWTDGNWDKETYGNSEVHPTEFKHYSECSEYCGYHFSKEGKLKEDEIFEKGRIKKFLANGDIPIAIEKALEFVESKSLHELHNNLINLSSEFKYLCKDELRGVLNSDELTVRRNKITKRLLDILDEI